MAITAHVLWALRSMPLPGIQLHRHSFWFGIHLEHFVWTVAPAMSSGLFKARWSLSDAWVHSVHTLTRQVYLGLCNEVWFHRFPSPSSGSSLFHPFPLHILLFPLSFHVVPCFMSCHLTPFFLLRATVRALVCTGTSTVHLGHLGLRSPRF